MVTLRFALPSIGWRHALVSVCRCSLTVFHRKSEINLRFQLVQGMPVGIDFTMGLFYIYGRSE